ncbi:MAG: hypothetical protein FWH22_08845 [Fibromonadales bacterium]|nr:hypothetical protein [Fibromonadales bacterium]
MENNLNFGSKLNVLGRVACKLNLAFIVAFFLTSCTHWLIDTETRIQAENETDKEIYNLSLVSGNGKTVILVPDTLKKGELSRPYKGEWVGKFDFAIFSEGFRFDLGHYELKGGMVLAQIKEENGKFTLNFR